MLIEDWTIILIAIGITLVLTALITYWFMRQTHVSRDTHQATISKLQFTENQLQNAKQQLQELEEQVSQATATHEQLRTQIQEQESALSGLRASIKSTLERYEEVKVENHKLKDTLQLKIEEKHQLEIQLSTQKNHALHLEQRLKAQEEEFVKLRNKSLLEFENIANRLFEEKTASFSRLNKDSIEHVLRPLQENLSAFKKKVEETYDKESKERFSLENKIKELVSLNQQISQDANNLTNALKGSAKTQGDWGEMILENILQHSGLVKNREYFVQESYRDEQGRLKQPDVKIRYPDDRFIIIDSKVSLTAYERFVNADDPKEQKRYLQQHHKSLKNHIDNLSSKEYDRFDKTLDFVMLFVPIEPAYLTALQYDSELWHYAYKQRILLISPTNLIAALKMVSDIWKREQQNNNAIAIAQRGEKLYEKFVNFIADMEEIDKFLSRATHKYNDAMKKLSTGSGNLIGQAEKLKKLGVNSSKNIPEKYLTNNPDNEKDH